MRRLVLLTDLSLDGYVGYDGADPRWPDQYYDDELTRYQRRVLGKAGVHALEETRDVDGLAEVKAEGGWADPAPIVAQGGARYLRELVTRGLVDEYRLAVHPVVFGEGDRLFAVPIRLRLISTRVFASGSLALTYVPGDQPPQVG